MCLGKFPLLEELEYLIPVPYDPENTEDYIERVKTALEIIKEARSKGKIPQLKKIVIRGEIPEGLEALAQEIEYPELFVQNNATSFIPSSTARPLNEKDFVMIDG